MPRRRECSGSPPPPTKDKEVELIGGLGFFVKNGAVERQRFFRQPACASGPGRAWHDRRGPGLPISRSHAAGVMGESEIESTCNVAFECELESKNCGGKLGIKEFFYG